MNRIIGFEQARQVARQGHGDGDDDQRAEHIAEADRHQAGGFAAAAAVLITPENIFVEAPKGDKPGGFWIIGRN